MRNKKKKLVVLIILIFISASSFFIYQQNKEKMINEKEEKLKRDIESHYGQLVKTNKEAKLYKKEKKKFIKVGSISKGEIIKLKDNTKNSKYFYCKTLKLYVYYKDVEKISEKIIVNTRYKKYLLFDENIITKSSVNLYDTNKSRIIYKLNYSIDTPIIIKDSDGVFVEYFNKLLFIKNSDIEKTYNKENNKSEEASSIPVTCYHFIYFVGDTTCNESICNSKEQIESHFNYLIQNNYFTINTTELRLFIEGKLRLPKNSILITIDDGARAENFIPILEQYKINATLFLVSSWYSKDNFSSKYLEIASHTHDLHNVGVCDGGQGSPLKCLDKTKLVEDLRKSRETLDGTEAFCYPFYEYNDYAIEVLKEVGFKMAFAGGNIKANKGIDLFKIPRITIHNNTSLEEYINYIN